jgi:hypothetical protein
MKLRCCITLFFLFFNSGVYAQLFYTDWVQSTSTSFLTGEQLACDRSGNLYSVGYYRGTVDFDAGASASIFTAVDSTDGFVKKLDKAGNLKWIKSIGNKRNDGLQHIAIGDSGNVFVVGIFSDTLDFDPSIRVDMHIAKGRYSLMVLKFDSLGNYQWGRHIDGNLTSKGVGVTTDAALVVVGHYKDSADFDPGVGTFMLRDSGVFILKLSGGDGSFVTAHRLASTYLGLSTFSVDFRNNLWLAGDINGSVNMDLSGGTHLLSGTGAFLVKYAPSGKFINAQVLTPETSVTSRANIFDICTDKDDNLLLTGNFFGTVDFDAGPGAMKLNSSTGYSEAFILKLDSAGKFIWVRKTTGTLYSGVVSITVDGKSNIIVNGEYTGMVSFIEGSTPYSGSSAGLRDLFILKLHQSGSFEWMKFMGGSGDEFAGKIIVDGKGNIVQSGQFLKEIMFDPEGVFYLNTVADNGDYFIHKIKEAPLGMNDASGNLGALLVYPNPAKDVLHIRGIDGGSTVELFDVMGKLVVRQESRLTTINLDVAHLVTGVYTLKLTEKDGRGSRTKVVIE